MDIQLLQLLPLPILLWILIELFRDEAIPVPLPKNTIRKMLKLARTKKNETFYDLGSGDGRTLVLASKEFGTKSFGIEKNRLLVWWTRLRIRRNKLQNKIKVVHGDIFKESYDNADVILIYLSHKLTQKLKPVFEKLKKGTRIVSASHTIDGWKEVEKIRTGHFYSYLYKI